MNIEIKHELGEKVYVPDWVNWEVVECVILSVEITASENRFISPLIIYELISTKPTLNKVFDTYHLEDSGFFKTEEEAKQEILKKLKNRIKVLKGENDERY